MKTASSKKIAVLAGGPSCEREVSLISGQAVLDALLTRGFEAFLMDPVEGFASALRARGVDMAFVALHGTFGEDGTAQRLLEAEGVAYTGNGPAVSETAFDKSKAQPLFKQAGILVPDFQILARQDIFKADSRLGYPLVVKPACAGSSVGISIVRAERDFAKACEQAFLYSDRLLVERFIRGRELTVGVLGDQPLPVVEVLPGREFYDYEAKYKDTRTRYECPARLGTAEARLVVDTALAAYKTLGCQVMARVDVILDGDGRPYVLEANSIPGLTGKSLLPKAAKAQGIDFPDLCVKILELSASLSLERNRDRGRAWSHA